jgi:hypothetical protein
MQPFQTCPKCGAQILGEVIGGLCPNCVGALALAVEPEPQEKPTDSLPASEKPGDHIGHYKLLQQIGEGGCGIVYMAKQEMPVRRQVALKIIKLGMDTRNVIARFEAERQALALMDHPNIAKVFDAGATGRFCCSLKSMKRRSDPLKCIFTRAAVTVSTSVGGRNSIQ